MRILVLNCYSRNGLAAINALEPKVTIFGGDTKKKKFFLMNPDSWFHSGRLKKVFRYESPLKSEEKFVKDIISIINENEIDGLIPTGTTITDMLSKYKDKIESETKARCAVENFEKLVKMTDKWNTYELCREIGLDVPKSVRFSYTQNPIESLSNLKFPIVIKPRISYASIGIEFFDTREELESFLVTSSNLERFSSEDGFPYIAQEKLEGDLHDVTSCSQNGKTISALSQQRLVSLYDFGGGGIINMTTDCPESISIAKKLIKYAEWSGPLVFDFLKTKDGRYYILELGPKIWGTTELTVKAGMNVPQQMVDIFVAKKDLQPIESYQKGLLYRWWFPELIFHWQTKPRSVGSLVRRLSKTFSSYGARRTISNMRVKNFRHFMGMVFNRAEL